MSFVRINNGYLFKNSTPSYIRKLTIKYNNYPRVECIPQPPTVEAIQLLQKNGYSYISSHKALVREKNNETQTISYLNTTRQTKDYVN
jgi:hypothetical protein|tara:strand:- start:698 stop:961 length:264 start_codon:yes stop_codon:yes gene_type:complete